jgi:transmembrane sensor
VTRLNWDIVDRYMAGKATDDERTKVEEWLARSPAFRMLVAELYRGALDDEAIHRAAAEVRARLEHDIAVARGPNPSRLLELSVTLQPDIRPDVRALPSRRMAVFKAAAAIAVLLGGSLAVWQRSRSMESAGTGPGMVTAPAGHQPVPVSLPDGSQVILSPGSTLRYTAAFGATRREVRLEGEAYFAVIHDAGRPFVVRAGDLTAEDLGTEFIVRAYPEDRHGRVIVRKGRVGIKSVVVVPGRLGRLAEDGTPVVESTDTLSWFSWTRGNLRFAGTPLLDALPKLSRWYNIQFRLADSSLGNTRLAGHFTAQSGDDGLDDALHELQLALGLDLKREGRVVTIRSNSTNP